MARFVALIAHGVDDGVFLVVTKQSGDHADHQDVVDKFQETFLKDLWTVVWVDFWKYIKRNEECVNIKIF